MAAAISTSSPLPPACGDALLPARSTASWRWPTVHRWAGGSEPALITEEHGCGLAVAPGDARALAAAIQWARDLPLDDMGRRGREAFERFYDRPIATEAYRRLLEDVVGQT